MSIRWTEFPANARRVASFGVAPARGVAIERDFVGKLPIAGPDIAGSGNGAVLDVERVDIDAQPFRRQPKKDLANLGAGVTQRAAGLLDGEAARGDALVGAGRGRSANHLHARQDRYRVRRRRSAPAPSRCLARSRPCPARPSPVLCSRISATTTVSGSPRGLPAIWAGRERALAGSSRRHFFRRAQAPPAPCGYASRSGRGCGRALPSPPGSSATDFASTAPPR